MAELPGEAAAAPASAPAPAITAPEPAASAPTPADAPETAATPKDPAAASRRSDRRWLLSAVFGALASAVLGSYLGYLAWPALTTTHPSSVQAFELAGALFGGVMFVCLVIASVMAVRSAKPATEQKDAAEEGKGNEEEQEKEPEETPYDFRADQRDRHRALIWAVPVTLALAAVSYVLIDRSYPGIVATQRTTPLDRFGIGIGGFLAFITVFLVGGCVYAAWPARVYGPKKAPHLWVLLLKVAGCWLAMTPFSLFSLGAIGLGIYQGVDGAWGAMIFLLIFGLVCGAGCCYLLAGSGALRGQQLKAGGEVPQRVRSSSWWHHFKRMLSIWATFVTVVALVYLIKADWSDFSDAIGAAVVSWLARAKAGSGEMPEDVFSM